MLARAAERRAQTFSPLHPRDPALVAYFGGGTTSASGEVVNATTAMQNDAVLACVRYIAETIASLPVGTYERLDRGRRAATEHWLDARLGDQFNRWMTSFDGWNLILNWILLRGNFDVLIHESRVMPPFELLPLHPDRVRYVEENGERYYDYTTPKNGTVRLRYGQVWHLSFMPDDGWKGKSVIDHQRDTIGRAMAVTKFGSRTFRHNAAPGGILKVKRRLSPQAKKTLRDDFAALHEGQNNAGRFAVFEEDMDWQPVAMTNDQAQFLETMKYDVISIARIFNVPSHKIKSLEEAKWANIEEQQIDATTDCIRPWCVRIEKGAKKDLLTEQERGRGKLYVHFNLDGLLRGDFKTRQEGLQIMRQNGVIDGNDWAEREDMNPFPGGDIRIVPLNMVPLDMAGEPEQPAAPQRAIREQRSQQLLTRLRSAYAPLIEAQARRFLRREADNVERNFRRHAQERALADFLSWLDAFYSEHRASIVTEMAGTFASYGEAVGAAAASMVGAEAAEDDGFVATYVGAFAARCVSESRAAIVATLDLAPEAAAEAMEILLRAWRSERPQGMAQREAARAGNAFARHAWQQAGVQSVRWVKGADCDDCDRLSGQVVSIRDDFEPGIAHGPLHEGCSCGLGPA